MDHAEYWRGVSFRTVFWIASSGADPRKGMDGGPSPTMTGVGGSANVEALIYPRISKYSDQAGCNP
jgi:hypothetical protein